MTIPNWFAALLGQESLKSNSAIENLDKSLVVDGPVVRSRELYSASQKQTKEAFGYKWSKRDSYEREVVNTFGTWLRERYGEIVDAEWLSQHGDFPILLDAGCGAGVAGYEVFGQYIDQIRYIGADISSAVDVAFDRFSQHGANAAFLQCDLQALPLADESVDIIFSEGVLHHCDNTEAAFNAVRRHLKPGGHFLFYVYRKKGPIREYTDDFIRDAISDLQAAEAWEALMPLTELGKALGDLDIEIEIPRAIDLLDIPAGKINLQRLFYWHVFKIFYRPEMNLDEMNHINFDWYAPANAHRHTIEEVREWCANARLAIEHEQVEEAGITIFAKNIA